MRKITQKAIDAFNTKEPFKQSNTEVKVKNGEVELLLFGNTIAESRNGKLFITDADWPTETTKERLNGLPNVSISQVKGVWFLNGKKWNGDWVQV